MNIKRINLYFNMNREEDSRVYEEIKELVKEIIEEYNFMPNKESANGEEKSNIPDDIFNFFEQI